LSEKTITDRLDEMAPDEKLNFLIMELDYLTREHEVLTATMARLAPAKLRGELPEIAQTVDHPWRCACGTLLGLYDQKADEMMFLVGKFHLIVSVGVGGYMIRACHRCGRLSRQDYVPEAAPSPADER
jgi:hypothetical protein